MKLKLLSIQWLKYNEAIMTVEQTTRSFWFGIKKTQVVHWRGSGTVWHNAYTGERARHYGSCALIEGPLSDLWTKAKWDRDKNA